MDLLIQGTDMDFPSQMCEICLFGPF